MESFDEADFYIERFPTVSLIRQWVLGVHLMLLIGMAGVIAGLPAQLGARWVWLLKGNAVSIVLLLLMAAPCPLLFFRLCFLYRRRIRHILDCGTPGARFSDGGN